MPAVIVRTYVASCTRQGILHDDLVRAVGDLDLKNPDGRVPIARAHDALRVLQSLERDVATMPTASVGCADLGPPGFMLLTAPSMECLLASLCRYYRLVVNLGSWRVSNHSDGLHLVYELEWDSELAPVWVEAAVSTVGSLLRDALVKMPVSRVRFRHSAPRNAAAYSRFFGCPIDFVADSNCIVIPHGLMESSARMRNEPMYRYFERQMDAQLAGVEHPGSFVEQVLSVIVAKISTGDVCSAAIARQLGMGERTLRRKLEEQGSCFRHLLEQARTRAAERMLRASDSSLTDIAAALGFSEVSAFSRAFRRGSGLSPRAYRVCRRA